MVQLAVNAAAVAPIPTATQDLALEARSRWADSFFSPHLDVPLTTWGGDVKIAVVKLAAFDLLIGRGLDPNSETYKMLAAQAEQAQRWLDRVAEGTLVPSMQAGPAFDLADGAVILSSPSRGFRDGDSAADYSDFWDPCG